MKQKNQKYKYIHILLPNLQRMQIIHNNNNKINKFLHNGKTYIHTEHKKIKSKIVRTKF